MKYLARKKLTAAERRERVKELQTELDRQHKRFAEFLRQELSQEPQQKELKFDEHQ